MPRINVDFRFIDIEYERMMLEQYVALIDAQLGELHKLEAVRIDGDTDAQDEADLQLARHLHDRLDEGVTTRFLTASAIVALWALYEAAVDEIADYVKTRRGLTLKLSSVRGTFVERARNYFAEVLKFPLHSIAADWSGLAALERLRHALAHGNGDLRQVSPDKVKAFGQWCAVTPGITIVEKRYLVIEPQFVKDSMLSVRTLLDDLIARTRLEFK